jgi:hypothetical protein
MKLMIDLFSGLGGASEAFVHSSEFSVLRYDNNPLVECVPLTQLCDLREFEIKCRHDIELIWASPPCVGFSNAFNAPKSVAARNGEKYVPDMTLVKRAYEIIQELKPKWWIIENVSGAVKDFEELLGEPRQIIGPFFLWGHFPLIPMNRDFEHSKLNDDDSLGRGMRPHVRAKIPIEISQAVLETVENQRSLFDF